MTLKNKIKIFRITRDIGIFEEISKHDLDNYRSCRICEGPILYPNTIIRFSKKGAVTYSGTSQETVKILNQRIYNLTACDKCMFIKFGEEYESLNKARIYNRLNKFTKYAFNIKDSDYEKNIETGFGSGVSKDILIKRHGYEIGLNKWEQYKKKQAYKNTFEFKKQKYNWSEQDFKKFNKKRAVTLNNMISKYGEDEGILRWDSYIKRQSYTCTYDYFIKEYGPDKGNEKWNNFINSKFFKNVNYSISSQELFNSIDIIFNKDYKTYYATKEGEFNKKINGNIVFIDYFILELNIAIEYNGDRFHANPKFFKQDSKPNPFINKRASEIWEKDNLRYNSLYDIHGIKTLIIWSSDTINISNIKNIIISLKESDFKYKYYNEFNV